jgi:osmotically-inducible protein OsmY
VEQFFGVPVEHPTHVVSEFRYDRTDEPDHKWEGRRDEETRLAVMTALHWDLSVPRNCIEVTVKGGWVTLRGRVHRAYERSCSESDALMTAGVIGVTNAIGCKAEWSSQADRISPSPPQPRHQAA